jgi:hypothetical protein
VVSVFFSNSTTETQRTTELAQRNPFSRQTPKRAAERYPKSFALEIITHRINEPLMANAIVDRGNAQNLFIVAEQTARFAATKSFLFMKPTNLKFTNTSHCALWPFMQFTKVQPMSAVRTPDFLMISLHHAPLSGSAS